MDTDADTAVFHDGELALQARMGSREQLAAHAAKLIRTAMPDQHRQFFLQLPFVLTGSVDETGQPWASLLANPPGFIQSPDPGKLVIAALPLVSDPLYPALLPGASIALLGIEQHTRRRNRANGIVSAVGTSGFEVAIKQSFGNCAKYIQARQATFCLRDATPHTDHADTINNTTRQIIERADTFFIASAHPQAQTSSAAAHGVDVSHRGGKPGFVKITDPKTLVVPDFSGNRLFNTLGNLTLHPRAGLLFIDFATGGLLHITASAEIVFDAPALHAFTGAERLLRFTITQLQHTHCAVPLRWSNEVQYSPFVLQTGNW